MGLGDRARDVIAQSQSGIEKAVAQQIHQLVRDTVFEGDLAIEHEM
jgi:hypothetical protein